MIVAGDKEVYKVLLEPDNELLENIEKSCPQKSFS